MLETCLLYKGHHIKTLDSEQPATGEMTLVTPDHSSAVVQWEFVTMTSQELEAAYISGNVLRDL